MNKAEAEQAIGAFKDSFNTLDGNSDIVEIEVDGDEPEETQGRQQPSLTQDQIDHQEKQNRRLTKRHKESKVIRALEQQLIAERQEKSAALQYAKQKEQEANEYKSVAKDIYEYDLELKEANIKKLLVEAIENGDTEKQVELQDLLVDVKTQKNRKDLFEDRKQSDYEYKQEDVEPADDYQNSYQPLDDYIEDWVEDNDWISHPELAQEAYDVSRELEKHLILNNQKHLIHTRGFMDEVESIIRSRRGGNGNNGGHHNPSKAMVAPVSRGHNNQPSSPYKVRKQVHLSNDERQIARSLVLNHPDGRSYSPQEKERIYAEQKISAQQRR